MDRLLIVETTKVAVLLDAYPELEGVLIGIAPPFKKLRNPVLRMVGGQGCVAAGRLPQSLVSQHPS